MASKEVRLGREMAKVRAAFGDLAAAFSRLGPALAANGSARTPVITPTGRKRPRLTTAHRAALKLQGRYMGLLRGLPPRKAAAVKRIRAEKGIEAAIRATKRIAARS